MFRLRLFDEDKPLASKKYILVVDGTEYEEVTDAEGRLHHHLPPDATTCQLLLEGSIIVNLHFSTLDPVREITGVQNRLINLGFYAGPADGELNDATRLAIRLLQAHFKLDETGELDSVVRTHLHKLHDDSSEVLEPEHFVTPKAKRTTTASVNIKGGNEGEKSSVENVKNLRSPASLRIHHIDVGQGEATLIEHLIDGKTNFTVLIDGGRYTRGGGTIVRYLRELGIYKIDRLICTHHDADHIEGLLRVLQDADLSKALPYVIEVVCVVDRDLILSEESSFLPKEFAFLEREEAELPASGERFGEFEILEVKEAKEGEEALKPSEDTKLEVPFFFELPSESQPIIVLKTEEKEASVADLRKVLAKFQALAKGKTSATVAFKKVFKEIINHTPEFRMTCFHCDPGGLIPNESNRSSAFLIQFGKFRYYTGGDLESWYEDKFVSDLKDGTHLCSFKCGHHGSSSSTSEKFLTDTQARHGVISCGRHSYYHLRTGETSLRLPSPQLVRFDQLLLQPRRNQSELLRQ